VGVGADQYTSHDTEEDLMPTTTRSGLSRRGTRHGDMCNFAIPVPDVARGRAFYAGVLGWTFDGTDDGGVLVDGVIPLVGLRRSDSAARAVPGFRVDDMDAAMATVGRLGGKVGDATAVGGELRAECTDDQAMAFSLHQLPPPGASGGDNGADHGDVSYTVLEVADTARTAAFLGELLGWQFTPGRLDDGWEVAGPAPMTGMIGGRERTGIVLCFRVADIGPAVERVRAGGGTIEEGPQRRPYGLEARCADDQGTPFYLHDFDH